MVAKAAAKPAPEVAAEPVGAQWVAEDVSVVEAPKPVLPEFERAGSPTIEDYIAGLKTEFEHATDETRGFIKAELDRVAGLRKKLSTTDAPKVTETA